MELHYHDLEVTPGHGGKKWCVECPQNHLPIGSLGIYGQPDHPICRGPIMHELSSSWPSMSIYQGQTKHTTRVGIPDENPRAVYNDPRYRRINF